MSDVVVPQTCSSFAGDELISTYERAGTQAPRKCDVGPVRPPKCLQHQYYCAASESCFATLTSCEAELVGQK